MLPRELHLAAAKAGLMGVSFPEEVGGQGGDVVDSAVVAEGSARRRRVHRRARVTVHARHRDPAHRPERQR